MEPNGTHFITQQLSDAWRLLSFTFHKVKDLSTSSCFWRDKEQQQAYRDGRREREGG